MLIDTILYGWAVQKNVMHYERAGKNPLQNVRYRLERLSVNCF